MSSARGGAGALGGLAGLLGAGAPLRRAGDAGAAADLAAKAARCGAASAVDGPEVFGVRRRVRRRLGSGARAGGLDVGGCLLGHEASSFRLFLQCE